MPQDKHIHSTPIIIAFSIRSIISAIMLTEKSIQALPGSIHTKQVYLVPISSSLTNITEDKNTPKALHFSAFPVSYATESTPTSSKEQHVSLEPQTAQPSQSSTETLKAKTSPTHLLLRILVAKHAPNLVFCHLFLQSSAAILSRMSLHLDTRWTLHGSPQFAISRCFLSERPS